METNWNELREQFFRECTINVDGQPKVNLTPHDLFEWFKSKLTKPYYSSGKYGCKCPDCNGTGYKNGVVKVRGNYCPTCEGFGVVDCK